MADTRLTHEQLHAQDISRRVYELEAEVERLREEIKRLAWCHLGPGVRGCDACRDRVHALGIEV